MRSPVGGSPIFRLSALAALALAGAGCGLGQAGIDPPMDQIFLPGGLAVDPDGNWLYAINSNNDLRFNAGTVLAIDLQKAKRAVGLETTLDVLTAFSTLITAQVGLQQAKSTYLLAVLNLNNVMGL